MMNPQPEIPLSISVVIAAYNTVDFLPATLDSVFSQTCSPNEVIVVDDGSTDGTHDYLLGMQDRIRLISLENSGGPSRPRNTGIGESTSDLISIFDSDDIMNEEKLTRSVAVFRQLPELDILFTNFDVIDEAGDLIHRDHLARYRSFRSILEETSVAGCCKLVGKDLEVEMWRANFIGTSSVVVRRSSFIDVGGFDESLSKSEDIDLWIRMARMGKIFAYLDCPLHLYRRRAGSLTRSGSKAYRSSIRMFEKHLATLTENEARMLATQRLRSNLVGYADLLRHKSDHREAMVYYRRAWELGKSLTIAKGYALSGLLGVIKR